MGIHHLNPHPVGARHILLRRGHSGTTASLQLEEIRMRSSAGKKISLSETL
jgi:hypothetical protein